MGVQGQVIGEQIDLARHQGRQAMVLGAADAGILVLPEPAVMHQDGVGPERDGGLDQGLRGRHASDDAADPVAPLDLQAVRAIITEAFRLQRIVQPVRQFLAGYLNRHTVSFSMSFCRRAAPGRLMLHERRQAADAAQGLSR